MKYLSQLLIKLIDSAQSLKIWIRVLILTVVVFAGIIIFVKIKPKASDCSYYIQQNEKLIGALIDIRKDLTVTSHASYDTIVKPKFQIIPAVSFSEEGEGFDYLIAPPTATPTLSFTSYYDTTVKPKTKIQKVISKIDSIIIQYRIQQTKKQ